MKCFNQSYLVIDIGERKTNCQKLSKHNLISPPKRLLITVKTLQNFFSTHKEVSTTVRCFFKIKTKHSATSRRRCVPVIRQTIRILYRSGIFRSYYVVMGMVLPTDLQMRGNFVLSTSMPRWYRLQEDIMIIRLRRRRCCETSRDISCAN